MAVMRRSWKNWLKVKYTRNKKIFFCLMKRKQQLKKKLKLTSYRSITALSVPHHRNKDGDSRLKGFWTFVVCAFDILLNFTLTAFHPLAASDLGVVRSYLNGPVVYLITLSTLKEICHAVSRLQRGIHVIGNALPRGWDFPGVVQINFPNAIVIAPVLITLEEIGGAHCLPR